MKQKVIKQRRRKETNAERKARRYRIDCERRRTFNELKKSAQEALANATAEIQVKEDAVEAPQASE